ncbi:MAG: secretion protein HlyD [Methylocystaceae bacterium]|nr:MAG: secretion protein HlyD [Methylocystaceae bacterium]
MSAEEKKIDISKLFRKEVFDAKRETWLGRAQVAQPLPVRLVVLVSVAFMLACIIYVSVGTYTRRVHATGVLLPDRGLIVITSPAVGIITGANVAEGQKVRKGQLLYVVNLDATSSNGPTQEQVLYGLKQQKAILEKERETRPSMAGVEKQALADRLKNLNQQRTQLDEQIELQRSTVALLKAKADQLQGGVKRGIVRDSDFQNQNYIRMQAVTQLAQYEQLALQLESQIIETGAALSLFENKLERELNEIDKKLLQLSQMITENEARRSVEIQAPADGVLTAIRAQAGQQVGGGTPLVTLLPNDGKVTANLFVDSSAIGLIEQGGPVLLRYAAFPFQRYGLYRGLIREVTRAPISNANSNPSQTAPAAHSREADDGAVYRIVVDPEQPFVMVNGQRQPIEVGMRVDADIALEKRPLYRWMLDPLYHVRHSLKIVTGTELK